jgi:hypothetical protein
MTASNPAAGNASYELYTMDESGGTLTQITTNGYAERCPALGPDTNRVAFVRADLARTNIFLASLGGGPVIAVGNTNKATAVQWGSTNVLYFLADRGGPGFTTSNELWRINVDGTGEARVFTNRFNVWTMGATAFHVDRAGQQVYLSEFWPVAWTSRVSTGLLSDQSPKTWLTTTNVDHYGPALSRDVFCGNPSWAPNAQWLAFTRATNSTYGATFYTGDIWRVGTNGTGLVNLTSALGVAGRCSYPTVYEVPASPAPSPFHITGMSRTNATLYLTWDSETTARYTIQSSTGLLPAAGWTNVLPHTNQVGAGGPMTRELPLGSVPTRLFRVTAQ